MNSITANPDVASVLALSDERDAWQAVALEREYQAYLRGHEDGVIEGRRQAEAEQAADWHRLAGQIIRGEAHTELEIRRWGKGGRRLWLIEGGAS